MTDVGKEQRQLAAELLEELEDLGADLAADLADVSVLMLLDALACGRLALTRSHDYEASEGFMQIIKGDE